MLDGFDIAKQQGNQGRALGFVITIFQKIAASSFAAVRGTLRRRQLALTLHEAILKDQALDIDGHQALIDAPRHLIHEQTGLPDDPLGRGEVERILADLKLRLMRRLDEEQLASVASSESAETLTAEGEELAATAVALALPEERLRIAEVLAAFPSERETKAGIRWTWSSGSDASIAMARRTRRRSTTWSSPIPSKAGSSCC
ncbi:MULTISPECIES: hypothetical protein [unclassified Thiocapsa]|uniref:hypothetical protein n=1 Tax=unclassified Thiocapsa TaxID=2641286 RepID=UPI0035B305FA